MLTRSTDQCRTRSKTNACCDASRVQKKRPDRRRQHPQYCQPTQSKQMPSSWAVSRQSQQIGPLKLLQPQDPGRDSSGDSGQSSSHTTATDTPTNHQHNPTTHQYTSTPSQSPRPRLTPFPASRGCQSGQTPSSVTDEPSRDPSASALMRTSPCRFGVLPRAVLCLAASFGSVGMLRPQQHSQCVTQTCASRSTTALLADAPVLSTAYRSTQHPDRHGEGVSAGGSCPPLRAWALLLLDLLPLSPSQHRLIAPF